jgi:ribokinase
MTSEKTNTILVIGSTNVDFIIKAKKLPSFGETVTDGLFMQNFGGKGANQAVGAARAGGNVTFISCLGNDLYADELLRNFGKEGINTTHIFRDPDKPTGAALIMLDDKGNNYLSVAPGSNYSLTPSHIDKISDVLNDSEYIVLQLEIPLDTTYHIFELAKRSDKKVIFNLAPAREVDLEILKNIHSFIVNEVEASMVCGFHVETPEEIKKAAAILLQKGPDIVIITLGSRGVFLASRDDEILIPAFKVNPVDTTGAGDIFCGSYAVAMAEGRSAVEAVKFACTASAISVTRMGAQPSAPTRREIEDFQNSKWIKGDL